MKKIIRKILKEDRRQEYLNKIIKVMNNDFPLFKNMKDYGFYDQLSEEEIYYVFSGIFGESVTIYKMSHGNIYNQNGNVIYYEDYVGFWQKYEYDKNGNIIYYEDSDGDWEKSEYDENRNLIYSERSDGYWIKSEYDENGIHSSSVHASFIA